ncbi:MAG: 3-oxoacyl-ACP synthase [Bacteroidota bacterium]
MARINGHISSIEESLRSETKSSAGDKHETGRAMLQLEREKAGQQLAEVERMKQLLTKVHLSPVSEHIGLGSLVTTSNGNYFLAISAGEFKTKNQWAYCISIHTPIGKLLLGKSQGESFLFNGSEITILSIE